MAYAGFLDPEHLEKKDGFLPNLKLKREEVMQSFNGAVMIIII